MSPKHKEALALVARLEAKMREQRRELENLRASVLHGACTPHERYYHRTDSGVSVRTPRDVRCERCQGQFYPGEHYVEYLDDDGQVVATYHQQCVGTR